MRVERWRDLEQNEIGHTYIGYAMADCDRWWIFVRPFINNGDEGGWDRKPAEFVVELGKYGRYTEDCQWSMDLDDDTLCYDWEALKQVRDTIPGWPLRLSDYFRHGERAESAMAKTSIETLSRYRKLQEALDGVRGDEGDRRADGPLRDDGAPSTVGAGSDASGSR